MPAVLLLLMLLLMMMMIFILMYGDEELPSQSHTMRWIFFSMLLSNVCGTPPPFIGYHILWLLWIILPLLSGSLFFTSVRMQSLGDFAFKNTEHFQDINRIFTYYLLRFAPVVGWFLATYLVTLHLRDDGESDISDHFYWKATETKQTSDRDVLDPFFRKRSHASIFRSNLSQQRMWILCALVAIVLQLFFTFGVAPNAFEGLPHFYWILLMMPLTVLLVDELAKQHDLKLFTLFQRRAKLMFDTLLGMHSPK
eukprot:jgi/Bigna1/67756/fgenesh1_pg.4_\